MSLRSVLLPLLGLLAIAESLYARGTFGTVAAADHHAEVVAYRAGAPFGTLVPAVAVPVIESLMPSDARNASAVERAIPDAGLPLAIAAVVTPALALAPESLATCRAAKRHRLQTSPNRL